MSAQSKDFLVIWDFDGVLCDSLYECVVVTKLAVLRMEEPDFSQTPETIKEILEDESVSLLHHKLLKFRPFVVRGQDYLWHYFNYDAFSKINRTYRDFKKYYDELWKLEKDKFYEQLFYSSRKILSDLMGDSYINLFKPYPEVVSAFKYTLKHALVYICSARDQKSILKWLKSKDIDISSEFIFSKDFNGLVENSCQGKTEQVQVILRKECNGIHQPFLIVEDQVKVPRELKDIYPAMKVICAGYGYGLEDDWEETELKDLRVVQKTTDLLPEIKMVVDA